MILPVPGVSYTASLAVQTAPRHRGNHRIVRAANPQVRGRLKSRQSGIPLSGWGGLLGKSRLGTTRLLEFAGRGIDVLL
jgi:hypothetical protein